MTDTLSINHNWFNGTNIEYVWDQLEHELSRVKKEMSDCYEQNDNEWKIMCQKLLLASHGMNYTTFLDLLDLISHKRMKSDSEIFGPYHKLFDLKQVVFVLETILKQSSDDLLNLEIDRIVTLSKTLKEYISSLT